MPVPASEAIASDVGHGALGLRDNLRPLTELLGESAAQHHCWIELRPGKYLTGWVAHNATGTYVVAVSEMRDGVIRDIVSVKTPAETLRRADSLASCEATAGTFFYQPDIAVTGAAWDDGVTHWDEGTQWDQTPELFIHPTSGNPNVTGVVAQFGIFVSTHGVFQPTLCLDKLTDGALETWASASDLTYWTEAGFGAGGGSVNRDSSDKAQGAYSCRIDGSFNAGGGYGIKQGSLSGAGGVTYRVSGWYKTAETNPAEVEARFRVGYSGAYLLADGRNSGAGADGLALAPTWGYWRRFAFDFICPGDTSALELALFAYNASGTGKNGSVWFDGLKLQRIVRWEFYEPLVSADALPAIDSQRPNGDAYYGRVSVAVGALTLNNGGGKLESLLASFDWLNQDAVVRIGGRFVNGGNDTLFDDCAIVSLATMNAPVVEDAKATIALEDVRQRFRVTLPKRRATRDLFGDNLAEEDVGKPRPLLFGTKGKTYMEDPDPATWVYPIKPLRIGVNALGYGTYEVVDCTDWPPGLKERRTTPTVYSYRVGAYTDEPAAQKYDSFNFFYAFNETDYYTPDLAAGRFSMQIDGRAIRLDANNDMVDFNVGGAAKAAQLGGAPGDGFLTFTDWLWAMAAQMNAAAGVSDITAGVNVATGKVYISKAVGTLQLLCSTGANRGRSAWAWLGFSTVADKTGALTYLADNSTRAVDGPVLRVSANGFKDDDAGTYTGTPGAMIEKAPDVTRFLLQRFAGVPADQIDLTSFVAARSTCPQPLSVYLGGEIGTMELGDVLERIENGAGADITNEGGIWYFKPRDSSVPPDIVDLYDRDLLEWSAGYRAEDYYATTCMSFDQDPATAGEKVSQLERPEVAVRFGRADDRTFPTWLLNQGDVLARLQAVSNEAATKRRRCSFTVKNRAILQAVGSKLRLNRTKGLDLTGVISGVLVRIVSKRDELATWTSRVEAIEVV